MKTRAEQREVTRERIIQAAREAFAEHGFRAASTRDIAARAGTTQGLITYHFRTKDDLWRAAAGEIFELLRTKLGERLASLDFDDPRALARESIREFVRFAADHPELFRLMVEQGKHADARTRWLVDTHIKPMFESFERGGPWSALKVDKKFLPHAHYVLAGAASLVFAVAPEVERLTGIDPTKRSFVEDHAEFVARLLVP